jgi:hypothetical protein
MNHDLVVIAQEDAVLEAGLADVGLVLDVVQFAGAAGWSQLPAKQQLTTLQPSDPPPLTNVRASASAALRAVR